MTARALTSCAAVAVTMLVSTGGARAAEVPRFADLPSGRSTTPPAKGAPPAVGPGERVSGLFVAPQPFFGGGQTPLGVSPSERLVKSQNQGSFDDDLERAPCVTEASSAFKRFPGDDAPREWDGSSVPVASVWPRNAQGSFGGVAVLHTERIAEQGASATLESIDAAVDPATRGARLVARASLPLKLVETHMGDLRVYVAREERPDGRKVAHFVVTRAKGIGRGGALTGVTPGGRVWQSTCGHVHVPLSVDGARSGETAVIIAGAPLPALDTAPPSAEDAAAAAASIGVRIQEVRVRELRVHVSVSQTSTDREPVVAVSSGWFGRERIEQVAVRSK